MTGSLRALFALGLSLGLRLLLWFLLTNDHSLTNLMIGLVLALMLPRASTRSLPLRDLLSALGRILITIPQAYGEALALMLSPEAGEREIVEPATGRGTPLLMFLEVFRLTLTPFTVVLALDDSEPRYRIHQLRPRRPQRPSREFRSP